MVHVFLLINFDISLYVRYRSEEISPYTSTKGRGYTPTRIECFPDLLFLSDPGIPIYGSESLKQTDVVQVIQVIQVIQVAIYGHMANGPYANMGLFFWPTLVITPTFACQ